MTALPDILRKDGLFCCWRYEERNGRKTKVECINTKNILTINNDAFMFGATFDTKDKLVFIDNKLSFNPSIIFDAELRKYVAEMLEREKKRDSETEK